MGFLQLSDKANGADFDEAREDLVLSCRAAKRVTEPIRNREARVTEPYIA
jgi:hypothetical protein